MATSAGSGVTPRDVLQTLREAPTSVRRAFVLTLALLVLCAIAVRLVAAFGGRRVLGRTRIQREIDGLYGRILAALAKDGFRKREAATPREFAHAVIHRGGTSYRPLARITEDLYAARFGDRPLDATAKQRIDEFLTSMRGRG